MQSKTALEPKPKGSSDTPFIVEAEKLLERMRELSQNVARRAYEFFEARGGEIGNSLNDWFRAESELLRHVPVEISETDKQFALRAEVPGFEAEEIKVSVEPRQLIISGESGSKSEQRTEQTIYNERRSSRFCRVIALPTEVNPQRATAALKNGVLELTLAKEEREPATDVEVTAT